jgi:hypothetical protein
MMRFNDRTDDPQAHAGAVRFGGKERIKNLLLLVRRQAHAGIADRDQHVTILTALRLEGELAGPTHILHRVDAVHHEVHQHLLQLHAISHHLREVCRDCRPNGYTALSGLGVQEQCHLSNQFVDIDHLPLQRPLLEGQADAFDDVARTLSVLYGS